MIQTKLLAAAAFLLVTETANAEIVADCGPSTGRSFFLTPQRDGWVDDGITGGRILFDLRGPTDMNIIFRDSTGVLVDVERDGGATFIVSHSEGFADFTAVSVYPATGVTETFAVTNLGHGSRQLLWTSNKSRVGASGVTKVSAFVSECSP